MYMRADSMFDVTLMLLQGSDYELAQQTSEEEKTMTRIILDGPRPTQSSVVFIHSKSQVLNNCCVLIKAKKRTKSYNKVLFCTSKPFVFITEGVR